MTVKTQLNFKYERCAALHFIRLLHESDWFSWQPGKKDIVGTERFKLHIYLVLRKETSFSQCEGYCHTDMAGFFHSWTGARAHHPVSVKIYRVGCQQVAEEGTRSSFIHSCTLPEFHSLDDSWDIYFWEETNQCMLCFVPRFIFFFLSGLISWTK